MNKYSSFFNNNMTSRQIALKYYGMCDSVKGDDRKLLDQAFDEAYLKSQEKELKYAFENSGDGSILVSQ